MANENVSTSSEAGRNGRSGWRDRLAAGWRLLKAAAKSPTSYEAMGIGLLVGGVIATATGAGAAVGVPMMAAGAAALYGGYKYRKYRETQDAARQAQGQQASLGGQGSHQDASMRSQLGDDPQIVRVDGKALQALLAEVRERRQSAAKKTGGAHEPPRAQQHAAPSPQQRREGEVPQEERVFMRPGPQQRATLVTPTSTPRGLSARLERSAASPTPSASSGTPENRPVSRTASIGSRADSPTPSASSDAQESVAAFARSAVPNFSRPLRHQASTPQASASSPPPAVAQQRPASRQARGK